VRVAGPASAAPGRPTAAGADGLDAAGFWPVFAARYYGREPYAAGDAPAGLRIGPAELFGLLLRACAARGTGPKDPQVKFYIAQRQVIADVEDYLPRAGDGSLDGYLARLETELHGEPYLLTVQRMHAASRELWKKAAAFAAAVYGATGLLPGDAEVEAFVGRYLCTPVGIHREQSGVFVFMVCGSKDMLVWPPETSGLPLGTARYDQARASARRLHCQPGRLTYWPALHWHVGECPDGPTAGLHIAILEQPPEPRALVSAAVGAGLPRLAGTGLDWSRLSPGELAFPPQYESVARNVAAACANAAGLRERLTVDWLRRRTGLGFAAPPPAAGRRELAAGDVLRRDGPFPIVLTRRDATTSWCAADGRVARMRSAPALAAAVDLLNSGAEVTVPAVMALAASAAERDLLRQAISLLTAWGVLSAGSRR
jgi:50S ribosomal protein L16 3-hydroxylase